MVGDDVQYHPDAKSVGFGDERLSIAQRSELGVDLAVVGYVVAPIGHGGQVPRVEPNGVDTQFCQVRQARPAPGEVADAVAVAISEAPEVHLVDGCRAPPGRALRCVSLPRGPAPLARRGRHADPIALAPATIWRWKSKNTADPGPRLSTKGIDRAPPL